MDPAYVSFERLLNRSEGLVLNLFSALRVFSDFKMLAIPWHLFFPRTTFGFLYAILI